MRKIRKITKEIEEVEDIICDICGKSCRDKYDMNYEYSTLSASWGYGSHKDTEQWQGDFCENCSDKIKEFIESLGGKLETTYYM